MSKFQLLDDGLIVNKISKTYSNKKVVRDITLSIKRGEIVLQEPPWYTSVLDDQSKQEEK